MEGGEFAACPLSSQPFDVGFHPTAKVLCAGLVTGVVEVWEYGEEHSKRLKKLRCHEEACRTVGFMGDGALMLTGGSDRQGGGPPARVSTLGKFCPM